MQKRELSVRRKADRAVMARKLEELARACGARVEREIDLPHEVMLYVVAARGLSVRIDLDANDPLPDQHDLGWHIGHWSNAQINAAVFGEPVSSCHQRKANQSAHGFDDLCEKFARVLHLAARGEAFLPGASGQSLSSHHAQPRGLKQETFHEQHQ